MHGQGPKAYKDQDKDLNLVLQESLRKRINITGSLFKFLFKKIMTKCENATLKRLVTVW